MIKIVFIALLLLSYPAMSQGLEPLPQISDDVSKELEATAIPVEKLYDLTPTLNFKVKIPNDFKIMADEKLKNTDSDGSVYGEVFNAYGPSSYDLRSYFSVQSIELERLISAQNWLISQALLKNYTIKGLEADDGGNSFATFYVRLDNIGRSEAVLSKGFLHENRLIVVEYVVPVQLYEQDKFEQIYAIQSFEFLNDYTILSPEIISEYEFLDSFIVKYPQNWKLSRHSDTEVNRHDISLKTANKNNFLFATADITVISNKSLKDRVDKSIYPINLPRFVKNKKEVIDEMGFIAAPMLERKKYDLNYKTILAITEIYPLRRKQSDIFVNDGESPISHEFWLTVIKTPKENGKNYVISMIAPSRDTNYYQWSLAAKAYELIVENVR